MHTGHITASPHWSTSSEVTYYWSGRALAKLPVTLCPLVSGSLIGLSHVTGAPRRTQSWLRCPHCQTWDKGLTFTIRETRDVTKGLMTNLHSSRTSIHFSVATAFCWAISNCGFGAASSTSNTISSSKPVTRQRSVNYAAFYKRETIWHEWISEESHRFFNT